MAIPLTPFEASGGAEWTPLADELGWIDSLLASTSRVRMRVAGGSALGTPIRVFAIGTGPRHVLHVAHQHGNEPSGRDMALSMLRQWGETTDPEVLAYLSRVTVHLMPTCHPDNLTERNTPANVDINRDHVRLTQPETRAIHSVIRDVQPDVIVDWHEYFGGGTRYRTGTMKNPNVDADLAAMSDSLNNHIGAAIQSGGWATEPYALITGPEYFHVNAGVQQRVSILCETPTNAIWSLQDRHAMHMASFDAIWRWHADRVQQVADTAAAARARARANRSPRTLMTGQTMEGPVRDPFPRGYQVSSADWEALATHRSMFRISGSARDDGFYLTTAQDQQVMIAYLVDPLSAQAVVQGTPQGIPTPGVPIPATGYTLKFRHNGVTYPATLKVKA